MNIQLFLGCRLNRKFILGNKKQICKSAECTPPKWCRKYYDSETAKAVFFLYNESMQIYSDKCFKNSVKIIEADGDLECAIREIDELRKKYYLLGYITYDFKYLYFEAYDKYEKYSPSEAKQLGTIIKPMITKEEYIRGVNKIKDYILEGVTYEVNYTYPSEVRTNLDGIELYESLLGRQRTPYNAYIDNSRTTLLSFSPELFFKLEGRKIVTKPMKGTVPCLNDGKDEERRDFLYHDTKNRAENIMIVDLLRNDLGRIAKAGSVRVDKLFEIEKHPTVFQMTSEVSAELDDNAGLYEIFKSIFPCGSITGAPKVSTMRVIEELEPFSRNIYCGAIGFLSPKCAEFSVPIRILYGKNHKYTYHSGGAIVWDSTAEDEWEETITKTKFIQTDFQLIETGIDDWESHLLRMQHSAAELGFKFHKPVIEGAKRILLNKDGSFAIEEKSFSQVKSKKIKINRKVHSANPFLYHKTTIREQMPADVFDEIGVNERGEITEGTFTNIAVKINGKLFTPPVSCGLLAGTYREKLLKNGIMEEKILYLEDLEKAEKIFCFNSVRKLVEVELCL